MDVYLVPVAADRYELYCEIPEEPGDQQVEPPTGFFKRLVQRFRDMIDEAERERRHGAPEGTQRGWFGRMRARGMRWVAESIAEQRLLWHLRRQSEACLFFPDDLEESKAAAVLRRHLGKDFDKHRFWLAIDSLGLAGAALLTVIPGPNVLAYYFAFRVVGHYLSLRGAKQGLGGVTWRHEASPPLTELRCVLTLDPGVREPRVHAVAQMLRLEHLVAFFERSAVSM